MNCRRCTNCRHDRDPLGTNCRQCTQFQPLRFSNIVCGIHAKLISYHFQHFSLGFICGLLHILRLLSEMKKKIISYFSLQKICHPTFFIGAVCPSVYLFVCLSVCQSICPSVRPPIRPPACQSVIIIIIIIVFIYIALNLYNSSKCFTTMLRSQGSSKQKYKSFETVIN